MYRPRIIPALLLRDRGLVKTVKFKSPVYVGDPVNAVRIFNDKEVDELVILDIDASRDGRGPDYELIAEVAGECFMPLAYGGGVTSIEQVRGVIRSGVEKVVINTAAGESTRLISEAAAIFGSQAIVAGIDVRKKLLGGFRVFTKSGSIELKTSLKEHVRAVTAAGAGEILLNNIDRDGTMAGYDLELIRQVAAECTVPLVAIGGAGTPTHLAEALAAGASAVSAGSMFVFHGRHRAVLISYPDQQQLDALSTG